MNGSPEADSRSTLQQEDIIFIGGVESFMFTDKSLQEKIEFLPVGIPNTTDSNFSMVNIGLIHFDPV